MHKRSQVMKAEEGGRRLTPEKPGKTGLWEFRAPW